ncbi:DNA gyrase subunit A [Mycoplasma marinum]|uniref:DNA gyrase subunit A n=1 Tax=Mycoplasma marinum TaxID=1937190 RepID=A0A4R0XL30_9MOLU|nr:DNA gyrase subunit A [Mycoplasma marinum]TCG11366.1 DNA gyrase subunit A [Mycoplasma marinum]
MFNNDDDDKKYDAPEEKLETVFEEEVQTKEKKQKPVVEVTSQVIEEATESLTPIHISTEMRNSFLEYAMSVIVSRALPDARDGLKPVHRRILYAMSDMGLEASKPHKKSARIVGEVLGKYHPHGDTAAYEAMVRMAQDFSMRYPLVDGHGNFGSVDGDSAAAMRYTEARMSKISALLVDGIKKDTVNFVDNYDGSEQEPQVLPARFPNLLVTGATGIAVGMATNIPPHNLTEVINGVIALSRNPEITIEELNQYVTGPDFPTSASILGNAGIRKAYATGNGSVTIRSTTRIEEMKNGKARIIVTELPFMVNKAKLIEKIAHLVKDKYIEGITDLRDESSRKGIRVVVELRRDVVPEVVLNKLFKLTPLQTNFGINMLALVNGEPKVLDLKIALKTYLDHQIEVVTRRTQFDLQKAQDRAHILEGLQIALDNIDEIITMIRSSKTDAEAQAKMMEKFELSEIQAKAITDMRLGRLTGLAREKMQAELDELHQMIAYYRNILDNKEVLLEVITDELTAVRDKFGDDRRTQILEGAFGNIDDEDLIPRKDIAITMSSRGYVKRIPLEEYKTQNRGGVGTKAMTTYEDDNVESILVATTHTDLLIFSTKGKVYRIRAHQIPELSKQAKGIPFVNIIGIEKGEKVVSMLTLNEYNEGQFLLTVTQNGIVKKTDIKEYERINKNGKIALGLKENDELVKAMIVEDETEIIIGASHGKVVRFPATEVRKMGRTASGVKGIDLSGESKSLVVGASSSLEGDKILSVGKDGFGKMTNISEYRMTKRGAKGVKSINTLKAGKLVSIRVVNGTEDIMVITKQGITIRMDMSQVPTSSRATKGVKIIKLNDKNTIKSIALIKTQEVEEAINEAIIKTQEISLQKLKETEEESTNSEVE